jgi:uncharacterized protein YigE (DUF2233 family)
MVFQAPSAKSMARANRFALFAVGLLLAAFSQPASAACEAMTAEGRSYTVCRFDPKATRLEIRDMDQSGQPYRYFSGWSQDADANGQTLTFAMNAGMFDTQGKPIGYYVEDGKMLRKLNRRGGPGNFHMKPNGVFYVAGDKAGVMETDAFARSGIKPDFASQSGPMLVINSKVHPKISANGTSAKIRNGVGVNDAGEAVFVISDSLVTFYEFASLFRDTLACNNALFFDGTVSALYAPELGRTGNFIPLGPLVGAVESK